MQRVSNHRFTDSTWTEARYYGGTLNRQLPLYVVAHDTAGRTAAGTVAYLADDPRGKVSYHAIIDRNGAVTQMVPLDRAAHHAGVSAHPDKPWLIGLNRCSIGIAFDNPGKLDQDGRAWFGHQYEAAVYAERDDQYGKWLPYTAAQLDAFEDIVTALTVAMASTACIALPGRDAARPEGRHEPDAGRVSAGHAPQRRRLGGGYATKRTRCCERSRGVEPPGRAGPSRADH